VFAGYGVSAPEYQWDDYEGQDVRGRVVLLLAGDPPAPPTEPRLFRGRTLTHHGRWDTKLEQARRHGAAGAIIIHSPDAAGYPWRVIRTSFGSTRYTLRAAAGAAPPLRLEGWIAVAHARALLDTAGYSFDELLVRAARRDFAPVATGIMMHAHLAGDVRTVRTHNVVGMVRGAERPDESVVFTAHYDHLGVGANVNGDSIYNGAYDNASGVAALLEIARAFAQLDAAPPRSAVFVFTTAEEAGLLGARHYVRSPALPLARTAASINIDGANLWGETDDFIALGGERSTLGRIAELRGSELGMRSAPDPAPELGLYFRSDHLPFALAGVPAVQIVHGDDYRGRPASWGVELLARWNASSYHLPDDEYHAAFDLSGAVQQARLAFLIGYDVAHSDEPPAWYEGARPRAPAALRVPSAGR
jgi:Zn-dependent M28 family amino/carboxypeptidase